MHLNSVLVCQREQSSILVFYSQHFIMLTRSPVEMKDSNDNERLIGEPANLLNETAKDSSCYLRCKKEIKGSLIHHIQCFCCLQKFPFLFLFAWVQNQCLSGCSQEGLAFASLAQLPRHADLR